MTDGHAQAQQRFRAVITHRPAILAATILALGLGLSLAGCSSARPKASEDALTRFEAQDYQGALRLASASSARTAGANQAEAAYIAGRSAFELKKYDEAERWLRPIARSADRTLAGRSSATLGLIGAERGAYAAAALDFVAASRKLEGDEAARALLMAGDCYRLTGRLDAANSAYTTGKGLAASSKVRDSLDSRLANNAYTLQVGAFSDMANAARAAGDTRTRAASRGLPAPGIVTSEDVTGRTLYLVQVGRFETKEQAAAARVRLGGELVVVPVEIQ